MLYSHGRPMVLFVAGYKVTKNNSQTPIDTALKKKTIEYKSTLFVPSLLHTVCVYLFLLQLALLEVWCVLKRNYDAKTTARDPKRTIIFV